MKNFPPFSPSHQNLSTKIQKMYLCTDANSSLGRVLVTLWECTKRGKMVSDQGFKWKFQPGFKWHETKTEITAMQGSKRQRWRGPLFCQIFPLFRHPFKGILLSPSCLSTQYGLDQRMNQTKVFLTANWMAPSLIRMTRLFSELSWLKDHIHSILNSLSHYPSLATSQSLLLLKNMTGLSQKSIPDITSFIIITHEDMTKRYLSTQVNNKYFSLSLSRKMNS